MASMAKALAKKYPTEHLIENRGRNFLADFAKGPVADVLRNQNLGSIIADTFNDQIMPAYAAMEKPWDNPNPSLAILDTLALPAKGATALAKGYFGDIKRAIDNPTPETALPLAADIAGSGWVASRAANVPKGALRMFAGRGAKTADHAKLAKAENMLFGQGIDPETVRKSTGWFQGPEGHWRFEIDDSAARLRGFEERRAINLARQDEAAAKFELSKKMLRDTKTQPDLFPRSVSDARKQLRTDAASLQVTPGYGKEWLGDSLDHPELFAAYPDMKRTKFEALGGPQGNLKGSYHDSDDLIRTYGIGGDKKKSTTLHEMQHAIQEREGFGLGGNPEEFGAKIARANFLAQESKEKLTRMSNAAWDEAKLVMSRPDGAKYVARAKAKWFGKLGEKTPDNPYGVDLREAVQFQLLDDDPVYQSIVKTHGRNLKASKADPYDQYRRLAGETEARNVQTRMDMLPGDRATKSPLDTQDYPFEEQIVRGSGMAKALLRGGK